MKCNLFVAMSVVTIFANVRGAVMQGKKSGLISFPRVGRSEGLQTLWDSASGDGRKRATMVQRPRVGRGHPSDVDAATTPAQRVWSNSRVRDFMDLAEVINKGSIPSMSPMYRRDKRSEEGDKQTNGGAKREEKSLIFYPRIGRGFFPVASSSDTDGISSSIKDVWPAQRIEDFLELSERMNDKDVQSSYLPTDAGDLRRVIGGGWLVKDKPRSRLEFTSRLGRVPNEEPDYEINGGGGYEDKV